MILKNVWRVTNIIKFIETKQITMYLIIQINKQTYKQTNHMYMKSKRKQKQKNTRKEVKKKNHFKKQIVYCFICCCYLLA